MVQRILEKHRDPHHLARFVAAVFLTWEPLGAIRPKICHSRQRYTETPCTSDYTPLIVTDSRTPSTGSTIQSAQAGQRSGLPRTLWTDSNSGRLRNASPLGKNDGNFYGRSPARRSGAYRTRGSDRAIWSIMPQTANTTMASRCHGNRGKACDIARSQRAWPCRNLLSHLSTSTVDVELVALSNVLGDLTDCLATSSLVSVAPQTAPLKSSMVWNGGSPLSFKAECSVVVGLAAAQQRSTEVHVAPRRMRNAGTGLRRRASIVNRFSQSLAKWKTILPKTSSPIARAARDGRFGGLNKSSPTFRTNQVACPTEKRDSRRTWRSAAAAPHASDRRTGALAVCRSE
jgi:hypothetical protein